MYKPRKPRKRSTTWLPFLRNHLDVSWAIDFFTVTTIDFATLYVFLVFDHGRRKVVHFAITRNPFMNWFVQQLRESMPFGLHRSVKKFFDSCVNIACRFPGLLCEKGFWQSTHLHEFDQRFIDFIGSESRIPIGRGFSEGQPYGLQ